MKNRFWAALLAVLFTLQLPLAMAGSFAGKDATGATKYWKSNGTGTTGDPYVPHHILTDGTNTATFETSGVDASSNAASHLAVSSWLYGYNGTTWDRVRTGLTAATSSLLGYLNTLPVGQYNATPLTLTNGQAAPLQVNAAGVLKMDGSGYTQPVSGTFWQATQPVSIASTVAISASALPLPTGAATAAKQPALGTAGTPSADVISIQGVTSGTPVPVSGTFWQATQPVSGSVSVSNFPATQPISGTVTANIGTAGSLALDSTLTGGSMKTKLVDSAGTNLASISAGGALKVDGSAVTQPVSGTFWQATQPVSLAAAVTVQQSTASNLKVDLSGTAANTTAIKVDGSAVTQPVSGSVSVSNFPATQPVSGSVSVSNFPATQPVSGTVTANIGTSGSLALDATLTGGTQKAIMRGGAKGATSAADVTSTASGSDHQAVDVAIYDASGNQITSFGSGAQYADGATQATPTGTVALGKNSSDILHALSLDGSGNLNVNVAAGGASGGTSSSFGSAFPSTGTAIGASDGTNMQDLQVESSTNKNLRVTLYSGANQASISAGGAVKVDNSAVTQPISAASLPLPTGAATAAKQPALGTAGSPSSDVLTIQGVSSMTAVKVDGSAVTQPVSGTVSVSNFPATQPVSGTVTATLSSSTNAGATAKTSDYDTGAGTDNVTMFGVALPASGGAVSGGTATNPLRVDPTGTTTQPVSGTVTANAGTGTFTVSGTVTANAGTGTLSTNVAQLAGTAADTNSGNKSAGTLRVVLATDQPQLTNKLLVTPDANSSVNLSQVGGNTISTGNGTAGAGTQRVTIASDNTAFGVNAAQSGTWTVQPGNTANTTPWLMSPQAATSGGATPAHYVSAASTNATSVKASAGQVYFITASNINASPRYLKLYNKASAPTVGTDTPVLTFIIPGNTSGAGTNIPIPECGLNFSTGIAFAITTGAADSDTGAVSASEEIVNIGYK